MSLLAFQLVAESHFAIVVCHWSLRQSTATIHISCSGCYKSFDCHYKGSIKDQVRARIINKVEPMPSSTLKKSRTYFTTFLLDDSNKHQNYIPFVHENLATVTRHSQPPHHVWPARLGWMYWLMKYTNKKIIQWQSTTCMATLHTAIPIQRILVLCQMACHCYLCKDSCVKWSHVVECHCHLLVYVYFVSLHFM